MHDQVGNSMCEEELDDANGEAEARPVVAVLEHLQAVSLEVDLAIKVHLVERLNSDLVGAAVLDTVGLGLEVEVVLDALAGEASLVGLAGADVGDGQPPRREEGQVDEDGEEDKGLEATADLPLQVEGNAEEETEEGIVVEGVGARTVRGERSIGDGGRLRSC